MNDYLPYIFLILVTFFSGCSSLPQIDRNCPSYVKAEGSRLWIGGEEDVDWVDVGKSDCVITEDDYICAKEDNSPIRVIVCEGIWMYIYKDNSTWKFWNYYDLYNGILRPIWWNNG